VTTEPRLPTTEALTNLRPVEELREVISRSDIPFIHRIALYAILGEHARHADDYIVLRRGQAEAISSVLDTVGHGNTLGLTGRHLAQQMSKSISARIALPEPDPEVIALAQHISESAIDNTDAEIMIREFALRRRAQREQAEWPSDAATSVAEE
jgi:hypothetical protein